MTRPRASTATNSLARESHVFDKSPPSFVFITKCETGDFASLYHHIQSISRVSPRPSTAPGHGCQLLPSCDRDTVPWKEPLLRSQFYFCTILSAKVRQEYVSDFYQNCKFVIFSHADIIFEKGFKKPNNSVHQKELLHSPCNGAGEFHL
jgi:hypothetical protein